MTAAVPELAAVEGPQTLRFPSPWAGGPALAAVRRALGVHGSLRFQALSREELEVVVTPGPPAPPVIALATIARTDAIGLERAILSALPYVDEVVIGVDDRSDEETWVKAQQLADVAYRFGADDIGLGAEDWAADKIHFANARNLGRSKVRAPWTLVVDTDEYIDECDENIRELVGATDPEVPAFNVTLGTPGVYEHRDPQRFARTQLRYRSATHNQLLLWGKAGDARLVIAFGNDLRTEAEHIRRNAQRNAGVEGLADEAIKGDLPALFHLAKHRLSLQDETGVSLTEDYRLRTDIHGALMPERVWLAINCAVLFQHKEDHRRAEQWAVRALLDGPSVEAFCILGDIAEDEGQLLRALAWFEAACAAIPVLAGKFKLPAEFDNRFDRRADLRKRVAEALAAAQAPAAAPPAPNGAALHPFLEATAAP